ncbi:MAG TPA: multicopper oxidase family protein [Candidatus Thermoplasmatota archaeon]|nr:multicopper oxidase family protein [Candidatus Thermoplasmatota archaeon]
MRASLGIVLVALVVPAIAGCAGNPPPSAPTGGDSASMPGMAGAGGMAGMSGMGMLGHAPPGPRTPIERSVVGLPPSRPSQEVRLADGASFDLAAGFVAHDPGVGHALRMLAYNGQVPGPTLRMPQGATVAVRFHNDLPWNTTVHWHGLRLAATMDGVPGVSQDPVPPGGDFDYTLRVPDEGVFWYHAHVREDLEQGLGLAGMLVVEGPERQRGEGPREVPLLLSDLFLANGDVGPYFEETVVHTLMGRYGNAYIVHGARTWEGTAQPGERVRLLLLDAANARPFRLQVAGAALVEWVASDGGFFDAPRAADSVVLAPGERAVVDVVMPAEGQVGLYNRPTLTPLGFVPLATFRVQGAPVQDAGAPPGPHARAAESLREALQHGRDPVRVTWDLDMRMDMLAFGGVPHSHTSPPPDVEWEDIHQAANALSDLSNVAWIIRDNATGKEGMAADYHFARGDLVPVLLRNRIDAMHPMDHSFHLHGQRFLVVSRNGQADPNPAWKDTVLVPTGGEVVLLVAMTNPGTWVYHCHISEHMEAGMMGQLSVA